MSDPHEFPSPAITVTWSRRRCLHAAECLMRLPPVFEVGRKPWVEPANATADAVARTIERCPTGALQYQRHDGGPAEQPAAENHVLVGRNGPLWVRGAIELVDANGQAVGRDTRVALCRCGQSQFKPWCDGSHNAARFRERGEVFEGRLDPPADSPGPLRIAARENGPLKLSGPFTLVSSDGRVKLVTSGTALCRCGESANKPFCDKSHERVGFVAPPIGAAAAGGSASSPAGAAEVLEPAGPSGPSSRPEGGEARS